VRLLAALLVVAACQGQGTSGSGAGTASGSAPVAPPADSGFGKAPEDAAPTAPTPDATAKVEEPELPDPGKRIAELGAISAWQAVIDRSQYLGRRKQRGVVYGRVGPAVMQPAAAGGAPDAGVSAPTPSPYVWLVDDTEGNGSLGIRVLLDGRAKEGDRVALGGAWELDDNRTWFWRVDKVEPLPPGPTSDLKDPPAPVPSHAIVNGDLPQGARTITVAKDNDAVYFQIVGPSPLTEGDGWPVANELGDVTYALLSLPGERPSYGGQDMRAPDERWQLKKGQTYWVRIGKIRKRGPDQPVVINARTAPVRVN
jgi:hypothetical protein